VFTVDTVASAGITSSVAQKEKESQQKTLTLMSPCGSSERGKSENDVLPSGLVPIVAAKATTVEVARF
tara:strand:- start:3142 stop:3345 length:204 start_codon:yes stop_codon:yes gene_type:complete